jgi:hypothetical protein
MLRYAARDAGKATVQPDGGVSELLKTTGY